MIFDEGTAPAGPRRLGRAHRTSLRSFLADLAAAGELASVPEPVDRRYELAAHLAVERRGPALLFEDVIGSELPVVANVLNSRERIARGLATPVGDLPAEDRRSSCPTAGG
jgi:4-hydroxy-3-polyprenylbenzoate decarboxylase